MLEKLKGRKLYRSRRDSIIAGVCGGIAEYLEIDATVVRFVFMFLVFLGGPGILLYAAAWLLIPEEPDSKEITNKNK